MKLPISIVQISCVVKKGILNITYISLCRSIFEAAEALVHAIDVRISNKHALNKINDKSLNYVFLQHGVMYMVSLDSESRSFFKPMKTERKISCRYFICRGS